MLNFFAATQDIAVDGWALTMLTKPNRNLASTMNSIGQTAGYFLGYVVFLVGIDILSRVVKSFETERVLTDHIKLFSTFKFISKCRSLISGTRICRFLQLLLAQRAPGKRICNVARVYVVLGRCIYHHHDYSHLQTRR